jgi:TadE-like protein
MVEFLAVAILVVVSLLGLAQMAVWVWARGVAVSAAHEGARTAAEAGRSIDVGVARTRSLLRDGLGASADRFRVESDEADGVVALVAVGQAPVIVPFLPAFTVEARATARDEDDVR